MSGVASYPTVEEWQPIYDHVVEATNCTSATDTIACLRTIPTDALSAVFNSTFNGSNIGSDSATRPQIDGDFLVDSGTTQLRDGRFVKVPYLLGTNFDEGASFGTKGINTTTDFVNELLANTPTLDNATINSILTLYPDDPALGIPSTLDGRPSPSSGYGAQWKREAAWAGDLKMQAGRRLAARSWAEQGVPAWTYHFDVLVNGAKVEEGAGHFREVAFVFDDTIGLGYENAVSENPFEGMPETLGELAGMMSRMWVSFIVNMDPNMANGELVTDFLLFAPLASCWKCALLTWTGVVVTGGFEWPRYTVDDPQNIVFDVNVTDLAYIEPDTYREEGIEFIIDHMVGVFNQ